jgi:chromosome segregation ATPase
MLFIIGAMIAVAGYIQSGRENETLRRSLQTAHDSLSKLGNEVTDARQKQAAAEQDLREVQAQQRARTLSQEQHQSLIKQLQKGPKGPIYIYFPDGDAEAQRFATSFPLPSLQRGGP